VPVQAVAVEVLYKLAVMILQLPAEGALQVLLLALMLIMETVAAVALQLAAMD
jgi:hypothetical protein